MPVNDAELREKKKGGIPPLAFVIGAVVFMGGAGFWYLDRASHQPPPGLFGRYGLDPLLAEEYPQPWIASQHAEDSRRVKIGHNPIVG